MILVALGVDAAGHKHVLGLWEGATENGPACRALLSDLDHRGVKADRMRLFIIDGSKALRSAIRDVYGKRALVQRWPGPQGSQRHLAPAQGAARPREAGARS